MRILISGPIRRASMRSGNYVHQPTGYRAFIPAALPPNPPVNLADPELARILSDADRALGRLDGVGSILPNPDLFVAMYVRHEAVLSSQIEGTQSTLEDVLQFEAMESGHGQPRDIEEVVNYVHAIKYGLERLGQLPLSLRLIREVHGELMRGVRGAERTPGEFRTSQNWIGPSGRPLNEALFVPPPIHEMQASLGNLELFLHDRSSLPALVHCGIAHAQFETIHPFLDGNGRVGRLLITFLLCERKILERPLLYLSYYLKAHRSEYYDRLMAIRNDGNWEGWLKFFLRGVFEVSQGATETARAILQLRETHRREIAKAAPRNKHALPLHESLFSQPVISIRHAEKRLGCTFKTASDTIQALCSTGVLSESTGRERNRLFRYDGYLRLFELQKLGRVETEPGPAGTGESPD